LLSCRAAVFKDATRGGSAFIASYQSALVVCDLVTAVLLFAQYVFLGATPLLALATDICSPR
jgi:hypothetical protein